ncbi:MAG: hypothetical protein JWP11_1336 [Frankiales bacterium]|nr:hypothetical protein [Frankiales bacterium]
MTRVSFDWQVLAAVASVLTFIGIIITKAWARTLKAATALEKISDAVLGDGTEEQPSLAKRFAEVNRSLGDVNTTVRDLTREHNEARERVGALEAVGEADRRSTRHAVRNLQHQVGFLFGHLQVTAPTPPADPLERDYTLPLR